MTYFEHDKNNITFPSKSLSHISLIVQPAPRITKAPERNNPKVFKTAPEDTTAGSAASMIDHPHGQNNNQVPGTGYKVRNQK